MGSAAEAPAVPMKHPSPSWLSSRAYIGYRIEISPGYRLVHLYSSDSRHRRLLGIASTGLICHPYHPWLFAPIEPDHIQFPRLSLFTFDVGNESKDSAEHMESPYYPRLFALDYMGLSELASAEIMDHPFPPRLFILDYIGLSGMASTKPEYYLSPPFSLVLYYAGLAGEALAGLYHSHLTFMAPGHVGSCEMASGGPTNLLDTL
jgi:hypothetical protein